MMNRTHDRLHTGHLRPREGYFPKYVPEHDWVVVEDVHEGYTYIWSEMGGTLFCDIDGTLADINHRRHYVRSKPKNWGAFNKAMVRDEPMQHIIEAVNRLYDAGWTVVLMSGRGEESRIRTVQWLRQYGVKFHALYMRREFLLDEDGEPVPAKRGGFQPDARRDDIVKEELLEEARRDGYDPDIVFDDRNQVVEMWRRLDIPVVQVAEGDF